jgi:hypothetical protein
MRGNNHVPSAMSTLQTKKGRPDRSAPDFNGLRHYDDSLREDQFLALSTILPAEIHGIMPRSCSPTRSI